MDASIHDLEQRKALKGLARQMIWSWAVDSNWNQYPHEDVIKSGPAKGAALVTKDKAKAIGIDVDGIERNYRESEIK